MEAVLAYMTILYVCPFFQFSCVGINGPHLAAWNGELQAEHHADGLSVCWGPFPHLC